MSVHPIDFHLNQDVFSTPEQREIFEEEAVFQRWLDFEAALASTLGDKGIIPGTAAREIVENARFDRLDKSLIRKGYGKSRNSLVPLLQALRHACSSEAGQYVHYGATTQDVIDTAEIIGIRLSLGLIYKDLREIEANCLLLSERYADTPMAGRTHGQQALPITFGLKTAVWLKEIRSHIHRIRDRHTGLRYGQFGGAVGTLAALGENALEIASHTLRLLGLEHDPLAWHTRRDAIADTACCLAMLSSTFSKIANEIYQLQKSEIAELFEAAPGQPASSTMPHKRNPVLCQRVQALSKHIRALSAVAIESMCHEHERDPRCLWAEWLSMPQICIYTGAAASYMKSILSSLEIDTKRMYENLRSKGDFIAGEWLLFRLGEKIGKMNAMEKLNKIVEKAKKEDRNIGELVMEDPGIGGLFSKGDLFMLDSPEAYTGQAVNIINQVAGQIRRSRAEDPQEL